MAEQQDGSGPPMDPEVQPKANPVMITKKGNRQLSHMVYCLARDSKRLRELVLLKDRPYGAGGTKSRPKSQVKRHDRPEIELLLHRRDEITRLEAQIEAIGEKIAKTDMEGADLSSALKALNNLNDLKMRHLARIEDSLTAMGKEIAGSRLITAKLASDYAHLAQAASQHRDKMELASKAKPVSADDLRKKLAEKYGVSEEEVAGLLTAREVEQEPT